MNISMAVNLIGRVKLCTLEKQKILRNLYPPQLLNPQERRSVNSRLYIAVFSHISETLFFTLTTTHPQNLISYFNTDKLAPIKKLYSLHQSALVGDQNGMQLLGLYCFVSEELQRRQLYKQLDTTHILVRSMRKQIIDVILYELPLQPTNSM